MMDSSPLSVAGPRGSATLGVVEGRRPRYRVPVAWRAAGLTSLVLLATSLWTTSASAQVCAKVYIEIEQEVTLERQAFDARMRINNGLTSLAVDDVAVSVVFQNAAGEPVLATSDPNDTQASFFIVLDSMEGIGDVAGAGTIAPQTAAEIHWLIIPAPGAAGPAKEGTLYLVGANVSYRIGGELSEVAVVPDSIYVKPMPKLFLDYFLPYEVHGDNPYTDPIEPPEPFPLGVRVANKGYGAANKLAIESSQPKIVENELGLLIAFQIIGSEVHGKPSTPSLLVDFGTVPANEARIAKWIMTATLQGKFIEFSATFTHSDDLGGALTSLLEEVNTHTLVRDIQVDLPGRDAIVDFLAQDGTALKVYESELVDTAVLDVSSASAISLAGGAVTVTVPPTAGFSYLKLADPFFGTQDVVKAVRSDGKVLSSRNAWASREWQKLSQSYLYKINVFDTGNPLGLSYTLTMGQVVADNAAPVLGPTPSRSIRVGETLEYVVTATDPDGTTPAIAATPLPAGASFADAGNGTAVLTWTPGENQLGVYTLYFDASDGKASTSGSAIIEVVPADTPNEAPSSASAEIVTQRDTPSAPVTPTVVDADEGDAHWFTIELAPAHGDAFVTAGQQLVYVPDPGYMGPDSFLFRATDKLGDSVIGTAAVLVIGADDLLVSGLTLERDAAGVPVAAIVTVENTGTAPTVAPVRVDVRAVGCGVDKVVATVETALDAGVTPLHLGLDLTDSALALGAFALVATVDAAGELPEPNELNNGASVGVLLGAASPEWLSLGTAAAEARKVCAGATLSAGGRSSWGLSDGAQWCHDVAAEGAQVSWSLASAGAPLSSGEGRADRNGAWRLDVPMPQQVGALLDLTVTASAGDEQDVTKRQVVLVDCGAGSPAPMVAAPPYTGPNGAPAVVSFMDGAASAPWVVHPGTPVPGVGPVGSGTGGGVTGTGTTDQVPLGGPPLGALGAGGLSGDPFDAAVLAASVMASPNHVEVGGTVTLTGAVGGNDSYYGLPVTWRATDGLGTHVVAPTTWFYLNGTLHLKATWTPPRAGAWTVTLALGPGFQDAQPGNDQVSIAVDVSKPAPLLAGLALWLDASQGVTTDAEGRVQAWADRSAQGAGAAQGTAGLQPQLIADPVYGAALVRCDGQDDALVLGSGYADFSQGLTVFAVVRPDRDAGAGLLLDLGGAGADRVTLGGAGSADGLRYQVAKRMAEASHGARLLELQALSVVHVPGEAATLRRDGAVTGIGNVRLPSVATRTANLICGGAGAPLGGAVAELLVYTRALTEAERVDVELFLAERHGLYHPSASWIAAYPPTVEATIHARRWSAAQADALVAWTAAHPASPVPGIALRLWLRADEGVTATEGVVAAWADQGADPWADDATQTDATARPTAASQGGTSVVRFDGLNDGLRLPAGMAHLDGGFTAYAVARASGPARWGTLLDLTGATAASRLALTRDATGPGVVLRSGDTALTGDGGLAVPELRLLGAIQQPDGQTQIVRGGEVTASGAVAVPRAAVRDGSRIALSPVAGLPAFAGDIAELLVWDRALGADERHAVEVYLADRHGVYHPDATWLLDQDLAAEAVDAAHTYGLGKAETVALGEFMAQNPDLPIPAPGLALWLDATTGVDAAGGAVQGWEDRSPAGMDAAQADSSRRPVLLGGDHPAVSFDGVDDVLPLPAGFAGLDQGVTVFTVARPARPAPGAPLLRLGNAAGQQMVSLGADGATGSVRYGAGAAFATGPKGLLPGRWQVLSAVHGASGVTLSRDGQVLKASAMPLPVAVLRTENAIGGPPFVGELSELLVYTRALSAAEHQAVAAWLADRHGLYHPAATWVDGYAEDVVARIHAERWSQAEADAFVAFGGVASDAGIPGAGVSVWLRGDQVVAGPDGAVALWADLAPVPSPADASQTVEGAQPLVLPSEVGIGGAPAVRFDGLDDALELPPGFVDFDRGVSAFVVLRPAAGDRWGHIVELATSGGAAPISLSRKGTTTTLRYRSGNVAADGAALLGGTSWRVLSVVHAIDGTVALRQHGLDGATGSATLPPLAWRDGSRVGAGVAGHLTGDLAELLIYDRALGDEDRASVEVYLADRYGLYHPDAAWITGSGYEEGIITMIHAQAWSKAQADAVAGQ
ncbi:MAG: hypothetical protein AMXMBFR64_26820 [Myxococcales bacterium]